MIGIRKKTNCKQPRVDIKSNTDVRYIALRFGRWVLSTSNVEIFKVDEAVWQGAWEMFQSYEDKQWAFTDCTSFVLMRQHNLHRAFTFDRHFEQDGFQLWPGMDE